MRFSKSLGPLTCLSTLPVVAAQFKAIETPSTTDDRQWLTYWSIFGVVKMVEYFLNVLLYWVPYWFLIKTSFFLWLALPQFRVCDFHGLE
jgi:receptor expression-enhancing protein 5/6